MRWNIYLFFRIAGCIVIWGCQGEDADSKISFPTRTASLNFDDAVRYCEKIGASLPSLSLTNTSIYELMVQVARSINIKSFWLGLRKWQNGKFLYLNNRYPTTELRSIHGNCGIYDIFNPIPVRAIECRLLYPGYICRSAYDQADCRNMKSFIQLPTGCFYISRDPGNWFSARYACQRKGLQLAYFDSSQEEADLQIFLKENKTLSDTNQFYWIGVRRMDYMFIHPLSNTTESLFSNLAYWENGQPKSDGEHSCVLATNTNKGFNWTAESCFSSHPVICEAATSIQTFSLGTSTEQFITPTSGEWILGRSTSNKANLPMQLSSLIVISILSTAITMAILAFLLYIKCKYQRRDLRGRNIRTGSVDSACIIELASELKPTSEEEHPLIIQQGEQSEGLPYYNILLVGVINAGKSTLINSSIMAINDKQRCKEYALRGAGRKESCTLAMRSHKVVCRSKIHIDKGDEKGVKFSKRNCVPVFWELPGLENKDSAQIKRIMKNLYRGGLYDGADIEQIQSRKFCFRKHQKIHLIVFVHPITEKLPDKVMDGLNQGVKTMRKGQGPAVPIVVVLTKEDLKPEEADPEQIITEIKEKLGATTEKCFLMSLYCFQTSGRTLSRQEKLDCELRKFWDCILELRVG